MKSRLATLTARLDALQARLDARRRAEAPGQMALDLTGASTGQKCGDGWISPRKECRKGAAGGAAEVSAPANSRFMQLHQETQARKAAAAEQRAATAKARAAADRKTAQQAAAGAMPVVVTQLDNGELRFNGRPAKKALGSGAFGDTWMVDTPAGPAVVKVDRLTNGDPLDRSHTPPDRATQRRNMVERERANMERAHALGLGPRPLGPVQRLLDGRLAFAYAMDPGVKLAADHRAMEPTPEAAEVLRQPGALARYAAGVARIARTMADAGFDHGDLHGGNILIGADGTPSLIDWGMAEQKKNALPHERAMIEAAALAVLGNHLVKINEQINGPDPTGRMVRRKPTIDHLLGHVMSMVWKAPKAYKAVTDAFDKEQSRSGAYKVPGTIPELFRKMHKLAESGVDIDEAERMVGLLPPLPDAVKAKAAAARDRVFGPRHLERFRRAIDQHYAALLP